MTILILFSIYSYKAGIEENPPTVEIAGNPEEFEGEGVEMGGALRDYDAEGDRLRMVLEGDGYEFEVFMRLE